MTSRRIVDSVIEAVGLNFHSDLLPDPYEGPMRGSSSVEEAAVHLAQHVLSHAGKENAREAANVLRQIISERESSLVDALTQMSLLDWVRADDEWLDLQEIVRATALLLEA